jgi:hypothetical protein
MQNEKAAEQSVAIMSGFRMLFILLII